MEYDNRQAIRADAVIYHGNAQFQQASIQQQPYEEHSNRQISTTSTPYPSVGPAVFMSKTELRINRLAGVCWG
jgi:hypothetical protein